MTNALPAPAFNLVVYSEPDAPADAAIEKCAAAFVKAKTFYPLGGGLGYLTLVAADFDRLWNGVDAGDIYGTAGAVLKFLGPAGQQFSGRDADFVFGWIGDDRTTHGRVL